MVKIIKKVKLNAPKSSSSSSDPTKGTQENPYTQEEFYAFEPERSDSGKDASGLRNANYPWHWKQFFDLLGIDTSNYHLP